MFPVIFFYYGFSSGKMYTSVSLDHVPDMRRPKHSGSLNELFKFSGCTFCTRLHILYCVSYVVLYQ